MNSTFSFEMLPVRKIELDYSNPRIAPYVEMYGGNITPEQVHLALNVGTSEPDSDTPTFYSLEQSIKTHGGLIHPILVNRRADGKLIAIEGNTRVAIYWRFLDKGIEGNWELIPAIVHDGMSQAQIDAIRLQSHLVGPRPWDAYSKAKYLYFLRNSQHLTMAQIIEFCGNRSREVQNYIKAYEDMEEYYRPKLTSDDQFDITRFSAFVELQNPRIQRAILESGFSFSNFAEWIIKRLIHPLNMVRQLPRILSNRQSKEIFLKDGAVSALKVLDIPESSASLKDASLVDLAKEIGKRVRSIQYSEVKRFQTDPEGYSSQAILEARDQLTELCSDIFSDEQ